MNCRDFMRKSLEGKQMDSRQEKIRKFDSNSFDPCWKIECDDRCSSCDIRQMRLAHCDRSTSELIKL